MRKLATLLPALALFLGLSTPLRAEGLVQLTLWGSVRPAGGAPVEVELELWDGQQVVPLAMNVHLGMGTRARDLATLVVSRLRRAGAKVDYPDEGVAREGAELVHVFVESVTGVYLRLGHGLQASVTLCDAAPISLRLLPPQTNPGGARVALGISTFQAHSKTLGSDTVSVQFAELASAAEVSEKLTAAAIARGWMADRPRPDSFACSRTSDGAVVTGFGLSLSADESDWRLEVKLEVPRGKDAFGR